MSFRSQHVHEHGVDSHEAGDEGMPPVSLGESNGHLRFKNWTDLENRFPPILSKTAKIRNPVIFPLTKPAVFSNQFSSWFFLVYCSFFLPVSSLSKISKFNF
jgi:hypothetical protein